MICWFILQIHFVNVHLAHCMLLKFTGIVLKFQAPILALKSNVFWETKLRANKTIVQVQSTVSQSYKQGIQSTHNSSLDVVQVLTTDMPMVFFKIEEVKVTLNKKKYQPSWGTAPNLKHVTSDIYSPSSFGRQEVRVRDG